eukprot:5021609-Prorocentrum_lima.AAC.1
MPPTAAMKIEQIVLHYGDTLLQYLAVSLLVHYTLVDIVKHWILCQRNSTNYAIKWKPHTQ